MIRVKLSNSFKNFPLIRQTPESKGIWGNCTFFINEEIKECDYWVVYENIEGIEKAICPIQNTILITGEPPAVKQYKKSFLNQFHTVITSHKQMIHPNLLFKQQGLPWMAGAKLDVEKWKWDNVNCKGYTFFKENIGSVRKDKLLSVISSTRKRVPGHELRLKFIDRLQTEFKGQIDIFGNGFRPVADKLEGLSDYKYTIVLENSALNDYWTEKLADAFLAECYPLYYGCTNIETYFNASALTKIDISNIDEAIETIKKTIASDKHEEAREHILQSKLLILDEYNVFAFIQQYINDLEMQKKPAVKKRIVILFQEMWLRKKVMTLLNFAGLGRYLKKKNY